MHFPLRHVGGLLNWIESPPLSHCLLFYALLVLGFAFLNFNIYVPLASFLESFIYGSNSH